MPMCGDKCFTMYPYSAAEKEEIREYFGLKQSTVDQDIEALEQWFQKQPHLVGAGVPDRDFLERMLIFAKGSRETTKRRIDNYYRYRAHAPELVQNRADFIKSEHNLFRFFYIAAMPRLFNLKRVTVFKFTTAELDQLSCENLFKTMILLGDLRTKYDYSTGDIWVLDFENFTLGHLLRTNITIVQKATQIFQGGLGVRMFSLHLLGSSNLITQMINLFKQFTSPKIMHRLVLHDNLSELYDHVPKKYLPKDYGGELQSLAHFRGTYINMLRCEETKKILEEYSKQVSDEHRRPDLIIHKEYLAGSFKTLDID